MRRNFSHILKRIFFGAGVFIFPLLFSASAQNPSKTFIVRRGDTVSYLAVRYYGFFTDSLFTVLKTANAHIADLNRIYPDDKLFFPIRQSAEPRVEQLRTAAAQAVLTFYEGPVRYRRAGHADNSAFLPVAPNLFLGPGDEIETRNQARAELVLDNRSVIRLSPNSHLKINSLSRAEPTTAKAQPLQANFDFSLGSLWTRVNKIFNRPPKVEIKFPTAIAGVQGTAYRATVAADSTTNLRVYEGAVEVRGGGNLTKPQPLGPPRQIEPPRQVPGPQQIPLEAWVQLVRAQQQITVAGDGRPSAPSPFTDRGADLDWVKWNQQRDRDLDAER
jgi:phage tail protein X